MPLHPQAQAFLQQLAASDVPAWHQLPPAESRRIFSSFRGIFGEGPELASVENGMVGHIPIRIYRSVAAETPPVMIYFHGGGWVLGNLETHDALCRRIAHTSGFAVVAVDYRLAPEHKYPAAVEDCYLVTKTVAEQASGFGVDARRLVVAGDSAGGNLAAAVALKARDAGGPAIRGQVLIYPVIAPDFDTESYRACATDHGLTRESMAWFWQQYVEGSQADRRYVELATAQLSDLPQAHVITAEFDVLCTEGERFAEHLRTAGVPTTSRRYPGMIHGFVHFGAMFDDSLVAMEDIADAVNSMVG